MRNQVPKHYRRVDGVKWIPVKKYDRKARKDGVGPFKKYTKNYQITYFRDRNGMLVSKRIYKPI